jgi:hypothetical protein
VINDQTEAQTSEEEKLLWVARQEIEYLRRLYARATDFLGMVDDPDAVAEGQRIYHRVFSPEADIKVTGTAAPLSGQGPDAWAEVASNALRDYKATQHLIGSQVVDLGSIEFGGEPVKIVSGEATMTSYLQAWQAAPDQRLRLVMGTYFDQVRFTPGVGWQITHMNLVHTSGEHRMLGSES